MHRSSAQAAVARGEVIAERRLKARAEILEVGDVQAHFNVRVIDHAAGVPEAVSAEDSLDELAALVAGVLCRAVQRMVVASAALIPPAASTVWASLRERLSRQRTPSPRSASSIEARRPAAPAPITRMPVLKRSARSDMGKTLARRRPTIVTGGVERGPSRSHAARPRLGGRAMGFRVDVAIEHAVTAD